MVICNHLFTLNLRSLLCTIIKFFIFKLFFPLAQKWRQMTTPIPRERNGSASQLRPMLRPEPVPHQGSELSATVGSCTSVDRKPRDKYKMSLTTTIRELSIAEPSQAPMNDVKEEHSLSPIKDECAV